MTRDVQRRRRKPWQERVDWRAPLIRLLKHPAHTRWKKLLIIIVVITAITEARWIITTLVIQLVILLLCLGLFFFFFPDPYAPVTSSPPPGYVGLLIRNRSKPRDKNRYKEKDSRNRCSPSFVWEVKKLEEQQQDLPIPSLKAKNQSSSLSRSLSVCSDFLRGGIDSGSIWRLTIAMISSKVVRLSWCGASPSSSSSSPSGSPCREDIVVVERGCWPGSGSSTDPVDGALAPSPSDDRELVLPLLLLLLLLLLRSVSGNKKTFIPNHRQWERKKERSLGMHVHIFVHREISRAPNVGWLIQNP